MAVKKTTPCNQCKAFTVTPARTAAGRFKTKPKAAKPKAAKARKVATQRGLF